MKKPTVEWLTFEGNQINKEKHSNIFYSLFSDIQECYEVTLQLNATEKAAKENGLKEMLEVSVLKIWKFVI